MGIFYEIISKSGKKSYLFGTLHLPDKNVNILPYEVKRAFEESRSLYVEIDLADQDTSEIMTSVICRWTDKFGFEHRYWTRGPGNIDAVGRDLAKYISLPNNWRTLIEELPPLLAYNMLTYPVVQHNTVLDANLIHMSKKRKREVTSLESMSSQVTLLAGNTFTYSEQRQLFDIGVSANLHGVKGLQELKHQYIAGQIYSLDDFINEHVEKDRPLVRRYLEEIITKRDIIMAHQLEVPFSQGDAFVAIGALHLAGIAKIYQTKGYTVNSIPITQRIYPVLDYYERNYSDMRYTGMALILACLCALASVAISYQMLGIALFLVATVSTAYALFKASFLIYDYITEPMLPNTTNKSSVSDVSMFHKIQNIDNSSNLPHVLDCCSR